MILVIHVRTSLHICYDLTLGCTACMETLLVCIFTRLINRFNLMLNFFYILLHVLNHLIFYLNLFINVLVGSFSAFICSMNSMVNFLEHPCMLLRLLFVLMLHPHESVFFDHDTGNWYSFHFLLSVLLLILWCLWLHFKVDVRCIAIYILLLRYLKLFLL